LTIICTGSLFYVSTPQYPPDDDDDDGTPAGKVSLEMYTSLTDIQTEKAADPGNWVVEVK